MLTITLALKFKYIPFLSHTLINLMKTVMIVMAPTAMRGVAMIATMMKIVAALIVKEEAAEMENVMMIAVKEGTAMILMMEMMQAPIMKVAIMMMTTTIAIEFCPFTPTLEKKSIDLPISGLPIPRKDVELPLPDPYLVLFGLKLEVDVKEKNPSERLLKA
jgi:hypothetical protein